MNEAVARLLQNPVSFLADAPSDDEISISTRVRLARNLADFPFPTAATPAQAAAVREAVERAIRETAPFDTGALFLPIRDLTDNEKELLFERHLASRELLTDHTGEGALIAAAKRRGAQIALFGHTHSPLCEHLEDGMWLLNPGSCGYFGGSAGMIVIENGNIAVCRLLRQADLEEIV